MIPVNRVRVLSTLSLPALLLAVAAHAQLAPPTTQMTHPKPAPNLTAPGPVKLVLPKLGVNLINNPNGDADVGAAAENQIVNPSGWTSSAKFTVVKYGVSTFPGATSPRPADAGANFFAGGDDPVSTGTQIIDLHSFASVIKTGSAAFTLSGWLGGFGSQGDHADVSVTFRDASGATLGQTALQTVSPVDRNDVTGMVQRTANGTVPANAVDAVITVTMTRMNSSYNDGYADSLVFKIG